MNILLIHNPQARRGGEDHQVEAEAALLRAHDHHVECYRVDNAQLPQVQTLRFSTQGLWPDAVSQDLSALMRRFTPDVIHVHNTPLMAPSLYWLAARRAIPVVQTLHDFRLLCPQAMFLREGQVCEDCLGRLPWRGVTRACYQDSSVQSAVMASVLVTHRLLRTWQRKVTRYIALSAFCRDKFIEGGLPADKIRIKPHFVDGGPTPPWQGRAGGLFIGSLLPERGLDTLAGAVRRLDRNPVQVIGDGEQQDLARGAFGSAWLGFRPHDEILARMARAAYLVLPNRGYEHFPRVLIEAFACGLPVIASRLGPMAELVEEGRTGLLFEPGNPADLAAKLAWAESHPGRMASMGRQAREEYENQYTADRNYRLLMTIYDEAMAAVPDYARVYASTVG